MPHIYKAHEVARNRTVRALNGWHTSAHQDECADASGEEDTKPSSNRSHPPEPSDRSLQRLQRVLSEAAADFQRHRTELLNALKPDLVTLIMEIAKAVVQRELQTDRDTILEVVDRAMAELGESDRLVLRVHPDDASVLQEAIEEGTWSPPSFADFDITGEPAIQRGGCVLESDRGQVDATIQTQLGEIQRHLREASLEGQSGNE